ncbi:MAG: hypothetical protein CMH52_06980, partial [Myxococcales bacterium]|nr:hypothetical protein [Myxococcales bacterium]
MKRYVLVLMTTALTSGCIESRQSSVDPGDNADSAVTDTGGDSQDGASNIPIDSGVDAMATGGCEGPADCPAGSDCVDGQCTEPDCLNDDQCTAFVQGCVEGVCLDRCVGPGTCFRGGQCEDGFCRPPECESDAECDDDRFCREGSCVDIASCDGDSACGPDERCIENLCEALPDCVGDRECEDNAICEGGRCRPQSACGSDDDCRGDEDCVGGRCVPTVCRGAIDCDPDQACWDGDCVDNTILEIETITITDYPRVIRVNAEPTTLSAVALDIRGDVVPIAAERFVWRSSDAAILSFDEQGLLIPAQVGRAEVVVSFTLNSGDSVDSAPVTIRVIPSRMDEIQPEQITVRIVDADDGRAVGGSVISYGEQDVTVDETGVAVLDAIADITALHVFSVDHDYFTLVATLASDSYVIPLRRRSSNLRVAGLSGAVDFSDIPNEGEVDISLSGPSVGQSMSDLSFNSLLGPTFNVAINAGPASFDIPIPSGVTLAADVPIIGRIEAKSDFYGTTEPGIRLAWSLAGRIDIARLTQLAQGGDGGAVGQVLAAILPYFETFQHGLRVGERLVALPQVPDENDMDGDGDVNELRPDYDRFPVLNIRPNQAQDLRLTIDVSNIFVPDDLLIVFSGVTLPGIGFVPLGVTAADEPGEYAARMAAPYGGLEVGIPTFVGLSARFGDGQTLPESLTIHVQRSDDLRVPNQVTFDADPVRRPQLAEWNSVM